MAPVKRVLVQKPPINGYSIGGVLGPSKDYREDIVNIMYNFLDIE
jgi:hypothetical protein